MNAAKKRRSQMALALLALGSAVTAAPLARAGDDDRRDGLARGFSTELSGYNEVHFIAAPTPALRGAVSSRGKGQFRALVEDANQRILYELEYSGLEGSVTQGHIHFGQKHTVGGIVVWLCHTANTPAPASVAAATPLCPQDTAVSGPVRGVITPSQVLAQEAQGISSGEFQELVRAIRAGAAYANVHSELFPPGEIRGQIEEHERHRHSDRR
jgi:hypothetical protein